MNIIYIANIRLPTEKAHGIQIMEMCHAFAAAGHTVRLVVPRRLNYIHVDPFVYYGIDKNFKVTRVPTIDLVGFGQIGFMIETLCFTFFSFVFLGIKRCAGKFIVYSRDEWCLLSFGFFPLFWEPHTAKDSYAARRAIKQTKGIVAISDGLRTYFEKQMGVPLTKILVARDGVDLPGHEHLLTKEAARKKLGVPVDKKIILYTGHFYTWKGVAILIESARYLGSGILLYLVGGAPEDMKQYQALADENSKIHLIGHRPHQEIPFWLSAADVLVIPNSAKEDISRLYTSPLKLFEYMASGSPIVATNLPSLQEVLHEDSAYFVEPDDAQNLAQGIKRALEDPIHAQELARRARSDVREYTWEKRARRISDFIQKKISS